MPQSEPEALNDGQLDLKKRSRRRLVGAAALALLAVIVLPMVMDDQPRQAVPDLQVKIPSQDTAGVASRILPGRPAPSPMAADEAGARTDPAAAKPTAERPAADKPAPDKAALDKAAADKAAADKAAADKAAADKAAADKAAADKVAADKVAAEKAAAEKKAGEARSEAARAAAALSGASDGQWLVLLGAYKEEANVKQLTGKLKQMGLPTYTERYDSPQGARTRVRCGPFKSQDAAEKAAARIRKIGVDGQVAPAK